MKRAATWVLTLLYLLRRDVKRDCSQIDLHEGIGAWQNEENAYRFTRGGKGDISHGNGYKEKKTFLKRSFSLFFHLRPESSILITLVHPCSNPLKATIHHISTAPLGNT